MTYIAVSAAGPSADIYTDTLTYERTGLSFGHTSKVSVMPHLDTAILTRGDGMFAARWRMVAGGLAQDAVDFDNLNDVAPASLRTCWQHRPDGRGAPRDVLVIHVGYSPSRGAFHALMFDPRDDFTPQDVPGMFVVPSPFERRPSDFELTEWEQHRAGMMPPDIIARNLRALRDKPPGSIPANRAEWLDLALRARVDRALGIPASTGLKVFVGGDLWHTHLERGAITQERVWRFNDAGAELVTMVRDTFHPLSQGGPCTCGSGLTAVACCTGRHNNGKPCPCGSADPFERCCSIAART